jgi:branched-chain amino acid aminotransferase
MTKPFIRLRPFSPRSSGAPRAGAWSDGCAGTALPIEALDSLAPFETLRAYGGRLFRADEHLRRLNETCRGLARPLPVPAGQARGWLEESLKAGGWREALLRVSVHWTGEASGILAVIVRRFAEHPRALYEHGADVVTAVPRRASPRAQEPLLKCNQFVTGVLARVDDPSRGAARETLLLGPAGDVAEGSVSNIFAVKAKRLLTPSAASGILRGVTRDLVIALARRRRLDPLETRLTRHELYAADECFLTNTSSEVMPVTAVDGRRIGGGRPGPVTRLLAADFKATVRNELGL